MLTYSTNQMLPKDDALRGLTDTGRHYYDSVPHPAALVSQPREE